MSDCTCNQCNICTAFIGAILVELVCDFIKDENEKWWMVQVRQFAFTCMIHRINKSAGEGLTTFGE